LHNLVNVAGIACLRSYAPRLAVVSMAAYVTLQQLMVTGLAANNLLVLLHMVLRVAGNPGHAAIPTFNSRAHDEGEAGVVLQ
jgi:hypothetical protein